MFDVAINSRTVLENYDISADARARSGKCFGVALVKEFAQVADAAGNITVEFSAVTDVPEINGIEILPVAIRSAPSTPGGLSVSSGAQANVLCWNAVPGAASYNIYRSLDPGTLGNAVYQSTGATAFVDACSSATLYYSVQAVNGAGSSSLSTDVESPALAGTPPAHIAPPSPHAVPAKADFNGDGKSDLIWQNDADGTVGVWMMNGPNLISSASVAQVGDLHWKVVGTGDFSGNGQPDLVWQNQASGDAAIWLMSGTSVQTGISLPHPPDTHWKIAGVGDFDGDGRPDLLWQNSATGQALVWLMNGTKPRSCKPLPRAADKNWKVMATGDFGGTAKADLVWQNSVTGKVELWLMNGVHVSARTPLTRRPVGAAWSVAGTGTFGDGPQSDLIWQNARNGTILLEMMSGSTATSLVNFNPLSAPGPSWKLRNH